MLKLLIGADVVMAASLAWRFPHLPEQIPLFYSRPWGEAQLADVWYILLLPILVHLFYFFNTYIIKRFFRDDVLFPRMFSVTTSVLIIVCTGIFLKILFLVT